MNLPNLLTLSRLVAIPALMVLLIARFPGHDQWAAGLFLLASLTDTADGQLARRRGQVTELGKFLDPLADKLFVLSVLIVLVQEGMLAAWVVIVIFGREMLITILRSLSASQGRVIAATPFGKTKTVTQVGAVLLLILARPYPQLQPLAILAIGVAVVFTVFSGIDYVWRFRDVLIRAEPGLSPLPVPQGGAPDSSAADPLARELGERLERAGLTLATAESCTGGLVASLITERPGSSAYFLGSVVAYANRIKTDVLRVPAALIDEQGAVSEAVCRAMAEGVRKLYGSDLAVGVTGIAGPAADGTDKPIGLTYIWVCGPDLNQGRRFVFEGDRWQNRRRAAEEALRLLLAAVDVQTRVR
ncbi:MAG TPA: CDP-diacylglycerol--glycerol-3-phosphate 3-phosphatidyltransferase [Candidatus Dormibacteraeota bacterium]